MRGQVFQQLVSTAGECERPLQLAGISSNGTHTTSPVAVNKKSPAMAMDRPYTSTITLSRWDP